MNNNIFPPSFLKKKAIVFSFLLALPVFLLGQFQADGPLLHAEQTLASRVFTKESVLTPTTYPESGFLLCDGVETPEYFRFFYFSTAVQEFNSHFVTLQKDTVTNTPGTLMNISMFNGLKTIKVNFSGEGTPTLYAKANGSLYEDFQNSSSYFSLTSGLTVDLNPLFDDLGYLTIINDSSIPVHIDSIEINYLCTHEIDQYFYSDESNNLGYARSAYSYLMQEHDQFLLMSNPTETTNNYSQGEYAGHPNKWYRWNGLALKNYQLDGEILNWGATPCGALVDDNIVIQMTAFIDPEIFYDPYAFFHIGPWVEVGDSTHTSLGWIQSYIGNDNYDPIGGINTERTDTYRGRFFTNFDWDPDYYGVGSGDWAFQNPDTTFVVGDPTTSLRDAYESNSLPFFNINFIIQGNSYQLIINNHLVFSSDNYFYETYTNQQYTIQQIHLQAVNYGSEADPEAIPPTELGDPLSAYFYGFTNPQISTPER